VHWYRNIFSHVPSTKVREIAAMLKAIHASEDIVAAREKAVRVTEKLRSPRLTRAADLVEAAIEETLTYYAFPEEHWRRIRTTDEMDKDFFAIRRTSLESILLFDARGDVLPSRLPIFGRRAQGQSRQAASSAATVRLGLDRPEHGGMLDRSGLERPDDDRRSPARLELTAGDYCCRARATSWRIAARRLQASPGSLICVLPR
jgi:hypothetical protein